MPSSARSGSSARKRIVALGGTGIGVEVVDATYR